MHEGQANGIGFWAGRWPLEKDKPTLLFIHGAGGSKILWQAQVESLADRFNTVALDLPGHGSSRGEGLKTINDYARVVFSFIELISTAGIIPCGLSMGGAITQQLLLDYPHNFSAGVLICTGAKMKVLPVLFETIENNYPAFVESSRQFAISPKTDPALIQPLLDDNLKCPPPVAFGDFQACDRFDVRKRLPEIRARVLVVTGENDLLTPPKFGDFLADKIKGSQRVQIKDAGHLVPLEKPDELNQVLLTFLKEEKQ